MSLILVVLHVTPVLNSYFEKISLQYSKVNIKNK